MPGGDRTGPLGLGPRTGRRAGFCSGYDVPGYANPVVGYGRGFGFGRGWGRGFGRGRGFWWREYYPNSVPYPRYTYPRESRDDEKTYLENLVKDLEEDLRRAKERLQEILKDKKESE